MIQRTGNEGMNLIRSIVFLTLGAVVAETFGTSSIFQYENGFLAAAISFRKLYSDAPRRTPRSCRNDAESRR